MPGPHKWAQSGPWPFVKVCLHEKCCIFLHDSFCIMQAMVQSISEDNYKMKGNKIKGYSTRDSQAVTHPSTSPACGCLTSEIERDRVHSTEYGRIRKYGDLRSIYNCHATCELIKLSRESVLQRAHKLRGGWREECVSHL